MNKNMIIAKQLIKLAYEISGCCKTEYLYHATYKPLLNNIKKKGLGGNNKKNWNDSKDNVVYLADDPDIAESFAEANEEINE
jgi:hypothetical protein